MVMIETKVCSRCRVRKPYYEFGYLGRVKSRLQSWCRSRGTQHKREDRRERPEHHRSIEEGSRYSHLICHARTRAKRRGLSFDLFEHREKIRDRVRSGHCEMTGLPFNFSAGQTFDSPSIDRINPDEGYTYSNIRIILYGMNAALGNWGEEKLAIMVQAWQTK